MKTVSAADANRHFSALLREVSRGNRITVTSRGRPIAVIAPFHPNGIRARAVAKRTLLAHLRATPVIGRDWTRAELYD